MCGIAGKVYLDKRTVVESELKKMAEAIKHRGPDDSGTYISANKKVGLANRRLAVIDLTKAGHMPLAYKKRYWITYNGEIYNYLQIKNKLEKQGYKFNSKTDTEVVVALYDKYGTKCLDYLRGMFAFAIYDSQKETLFLARDRVGKKPLKYYYKDNTFIFASELKAILTQKEVSKSCDLIAVHHYLTYGFCPAPLTGFKNIFKLEPGQFMLLDIKAKKITKKEYWSPNYEHQLHLSEKEWCKRILDVLDESTQLRMISDVPIGAFLSGGVDSSAIVAFMSKYSSSPVNTFTIGFEEKRYDESSYANQISKLFGTNHTVLTAKPDSVENLPTLVRQFEEPFADPSAVVTHLVSQLARKQVTVVLNGDGGDENFAGYDRYCRYKRDVLLNPYLKYISYGAPLAHLVADIS